jgi:hypothetical protein
MCGKVYLIPKLNNKTKMAKSNQNTQKAAVHISDANKTNSNTYELDPYFNLLDEKGKKLCRKWLENNTDKTVEDFYKLRKKATGLADVRPPSGTPDHSGVYVGTISSEEAAILHNEGRFHSNEFDSHG